MSEVVGFTNKKGLCDECYLRLRPRPAIFVEEHERIVNVERKGFMSVINEIANERIAKKTLEEVKRLKKEKEVGKE